MFVENDVGECFHERLYRKHSKKSTKMSIFKKKEKNAGNDILEIFPLRMIVRKIIEISVSRINDNLIIVPRVPLKRRIVQRNDELVHNRNRRIL